MGSRSNDTQNHQQNTTSDNRQVNDAGEGVIGNGNTLDRSTTWNSTTNWDASNRSTNNWQQTSTTNWDGSNRSTNNTTWNSDSSNRSTTTNNWDASDRSTTTNNITTTDGGAIKGMADVARSQSDLVQQITQAMKATSSDATAAGLAAQKAAIDASTKTVGQAIDLTSSNNAMAYKSSTEAMGFAKDGMDTFAKLTASLIGGAQKQADQAASSVQSAYSAASSQANGNKTLTIAALAAVGLVAALVVFRK